MNKVLSDQLQKVQYADLSKYDSSTSTYVIPRRCEINVEEDQCYLIRIKPSAIHNSTTAINWNRGEAAPAFSHMKVDISKRMGKMIKVTGLSHDISTGTDSSNFWSGWLSIDDVEVLKKL